MATLTAASGAIAPSIIETQIQESIRKLRGFALCQMSIEPSFARSKAE
jgi:hypothetical protein